MTTGRLLSLFDERPRDACVPVSCAEAADVICLHHYLGSFPSGVSWCYRLEDAVIVYSIPANQHLRTFLFGVERPYEVLELSRLWAPDGHDRNLLSRLIAASLKAIRARGVDAVVSFADPNAGHVGTVYQAASWIYTGQSTETRSHIAPDGRTVARRAFHSGSQSITPTLPQVRHREGKHRYVRPLTRQARRSLRLPALNYPKLA